MKIKYLLVLVSAIFLASCASKKQMNSSNNTDQLLESKWQIIELSGIAIKNKVNDKIPYLFLDKKNNHYSVITGCNTLNGEYVLNGNSLKLNNGMSTLMYCDDMSVEDGFKAIIANIDSYSVVGDLLLLKNKDKILVKLKIMSDISVSNLAGTSWKLDLLAVPGVDFKTLFADKMPTISFLEDSRISGNASCNNYGATYTVNGANISFGPVISTKMMCPNIKAEDAFLSNLSKVNRYSYSGDVLTFMLDDIAVMRFKKI